MYPKRQISNALLFPSVVPENAARALARANLTTDPARPLLILSLWLIRISNIIEPNLQFKIVLLPQPPEIRDYSHVHPQLTDLGILKKKKCEGFDLVLLVVILGGLHLMSAQSEMVLSLHHMESSA